MRLTKVRVTKLFGLFDHEIPLNREERITIIHGPNGFGKTIVLRMTAALISGLNALFLEVPFEAFTIEYDDGRRLMVEPVASEPGVSELQGRLRFSLCSPSGPESEFLLSLPKRSHPGPRPPGQKLQRRPEWLGKVRAESPEVRLIRTQRLDNEEFDEDLGSPVVSGPTVEAYSKELAAQIQQTLAAYAARSQDLDRTFPARLLSQTSAEPLTAEELRKRLNDLEQKRVLLTNLGFLDAEHGLSQAPTQAIETKRDVLSVYVADMGQKLSVFDEMAEKILLFTRIINDRFLFKRLEVHRDLGFVFTSDTEARLEPSDLSSGEQHELILLYELLFKLRKNALVLIDEPEISLHVAWQEKFLGDLMDVVKLSEIDVVIATHSPEIIGEHWDLTVELKGPSGIRGA
jgi:predicted ATP-binding protein involved in virulence